ncbi:ABC transporter substrate-binding protein [Pseudoxanthomonas broegbernensis]|uniref:ABC transporter substrate-binding protein n=1 Tax=Pseudoxanthomonas broegbernensis TaxID=83619 RepID=A0A7V8K7A1_9GAMM|nr:AarF/UbiB family protein [Pseudoxanthomonas broegbernensis]KAF1686328.1 ABC transporter substrate-binding protein [Pseudoxanthomonas broegbernensis]MBB6064015.1 putative unusual protein kinase regulating ubiquinone biosynthesis (AarF/ABC1/UbiB family) [Pseudoxanthomonas broegbernensis]
MDSEAHSVATGNAPGKMARRGAILRFLFRYRNSGVFSGLSISAPTEVESAGEGSPAEFANELEAMGPTFVKLGQMLSTRPDIVPPAYAEALERMQENVAAVPFPLIRAQVEAELGVRIGKAFADFDERPLGCASLAQVHAATLRDGRAVAVKVQRPDVAQRLLGDLDLLRGFAGAADRFTRIGRHVHFAEWLDEFSRTLMAELDYVAEAENLERFRAHMRHFPRLWVPQPYWDYTARRVLTMERAGGVRVDEIPGLRRTEQSMTPLAEELLRAFLDQVFVHGEIHADPHPGNLRVTDDGRLAIFDLGMVANVPPKQRDRLLKLLFAAVDGRGEQVAEESIALGVRLEDYDEPRYMREVGQLISRYAAHRGSMSEGRTVLELVRIGTRCGLRTSPELSLLGKALLNLDTACHYLSPSLDTQRVVEDQLQHVMRARLRKSLSSPNLASELMEVQSLLRDGPRKLSDILSLVAENRFQVRLTGLENSRLMENLQKIANRIAVGVIAASLIMASALIMRVPATHTLLGYPLLALLFFLLGVGLGCGIVASSLLSDHRARAREEHGPR